MKAEAYLVDLAITDTLSRGKTLVDDGGAEGRWAESAWGGGGREGSLREDAVKGVKRQQDMSGQTGCRSASASKLNWRAIGAAEQGRSRGGRRELTA